MSVIGMQLVFSRSGMIIDNLIIIINIFIIFHYAKSSDERGIQYLQ